MFVGASQENKDPKCPEWEAFIPFRQRAHFWELTDQRFGWGLVNGEEVIRGKKVSLTRFIGTDSLVPKSLSLMKRMSSFHLPVQGGDLSGGSFYDLFQGRRARVRGVRVTFLLAVCCCWFWFVVVVLFFFFKLFFQLEIPNMWRCSKLR